MKTTTVRVPTHTTQNTTDLFHIVFTASPNRIANISEFGNIGSAKIINNQNNKNKTHRYCNMPPANTYVKDISDTTIMPMQMRMKFFIW